jgi:hypothetical protein
MSIMDTATDRAVEFVREALALISGGQDPSAAVSAAKASTGATEDDLSSADTSEMLRALCSAPGAPQLGGYFDAVQNSYNGNGNTVVQGGGNTSGGSGSSGSSGHSGGGYAPSPAEQIVYNYNTYEQTINDQDNIFSGNFQGDIDVDQSQTDIEGDGNVVTHGDGDTNAATGAGASAAQSESGNATSNSGDEAIQNTGSLAGDANTGDGAVLVDGNLNAPVVTGTNTGIVADGDVTNAVVGDHNQTAQVDGDAPGAGFNFGSGDQTVASGNTVHGDGVAGATGGDATVVSHNDASGGGAVSGTGDATGNYTYEDNDTQTIDVDVDYEDHSVEVHDNQQSPVQVQQDTSHSDQSQDFGREEPAKELDEV